MSEDNSPEDDLAIKLVHIAISYGTTPNAHIMLAEFRAALREDPTNAFPLEVFNRLGQIESNLQLHQYIVSQEDIEGIDGLRLKAAQLISAHQWRKIALTNRINDVSDHPMRQPQFTA